MKVYVDDREVRLSPSTLLGTGGEADVYDAGGGRAIKVFKGPDHPDVRDLPALRDAARERLAEHQHKLARFPRGLPPRVVAPERLATDRPGGSVVGYAMRLVAGAEPLARYAEPRFRQQGVDPNDVVAVLRDLHLTVCALHRAGIVLGDLNDRNVLVEGTRAHLIDADSFQFGPYFCGVFTERFVDPMLCDPALGAPVPVRRYGESSDWYAYAAMLFSTLLCVGPFGGVHKPRDPARRVPHAARPLRRVSIFDPEVVPPRAALPVKALPDELTGYLREVFERDRRERFPEELLDRLRWTRCTSCGIDHARSRCPRCALALAPVPAVVRGRASAELVLEGAGLVLDARVIGGELRWITWRDGALRDHRGHVLSRASLTPELRVRVTRDGCLAGKHGRVERHRRIGPSELWLADTCGNETVFEVNGAHCYWIAGGRVLRDGRLGPELVGEVLAGQARLFAGERFGFGFYRTGSLDVAFTFDAERPGLADRVDLRLARGALLAAHAVVGEDRVWLFTAERQGGAETLRCRLLDRRGALLASAEEPSTESSWLAAGVGALAAGAVLLVPTDLGVVRVERDGGALRPTRTFADTAPFVDGATRLLAGQGGLYAVGAERIHLLRTRQETTP